MHTVTRREKMKTEQHKLAFSRNLVALVCSFSAGCYALSHLPTCFRSPQELLPSWDRRYLFNMMVTLETADTRYNVSRRAEALKKRLLRDPSYTMVAYVRNTEHWRPTLPPNSDNRTAATAIDKPLPAAKYQQVLKESVFTLAPPGHNPETFRIFEAAEAGSIPIMDRRTNPTECVNPWRPFLDSNAPVVWIDDWNKVDEVLLSLYAQKDRVLKMQHDLLQWYDRFMRAGVSTLQDTIREHVVASVQRGKPRGRKRQHEEDPEGGEGGSSGRFDVSEEDW